MKSQGFKWGLVVPFYGKLMTRDLARYSVARIWRASQGLNSLKRLNGLLLGQTIWIQQNLVLNIFNMKDTQKFPFEISFVYMRYIIYRIWNIYILVFIINQLKLSKNLTHLTKIVLDHPDKSALKDFAKISKLKKNKHSV